MEKNEVSIQNFTVIGLGLIGGSMAMAIRERYPDSHIQGVDPDAKTLQYALKHQVINQASLTLPETFKENHLIIIACHISQALDILREIAPKLAGLQNVLVSDIGSCKQEIATLGQTLLPTQFIPGHPMAGKEFSGIMHATPLLFAGKSYLLCPHPETDPLKLETLKAFISSIGGIPRLIDAVRHDRYMAYVSHLPQLYSVLLTNLLYRNEPGHLVAYHGAGLDDQLRLAASPYGMWGDVLSHNAENMTHVLQELQGIINEMLAILNHSDETGQTSSTMNTLEDWFSRANEIHRQFQNIRQRS